MQGKSSKGKGYRGEVEFRDLLRRHGFYATREKGSLDDVTHSVPGIHFEVKRREKLDIPAHMKQAKAQAGDRIPVVAFRGNRQPWRVILDAEDFLTLLFTSNMRKLLLEWEKEREQLLEPLPPVLPLSTTSVAEACTCEKPSHVFGDGACCDCGRPARVESLEEVPTEEAHGRDYGDECSCGRCQTPPSRPL